MAKKYPNKAELIKVNEAQYEQLCQLKSDNNRLERNYADSSEFNAKLKVDKTRLSKSLRVVGGLGRQLLDEAERIKHGDTRNNMGQIEVIEPADPDYQSLFNQLAGSVTAACDIGTADPDGNNHCSTSTIRVSYS